MANFFKKLKRKRKRNKLLKERAKLEKAQESSGQITDYQERLTKHKHAAARKTIITVAVIVVAVAGALLFFEKRSYHNYKVLQTSEQEDVVSTKYAEMSGKIIRYSPDGASLIDNSMEASWSTVYEMDNPVADVNGTRAVIADQDGTLMEMFDKNGETGKVTTSYSIVKATISSNGMVAAILDGGDATWINFYSSDGTLIAENQTHLEDPGYPLDVAVAGNGEILMVAYQFVEGSTTTSYVAFYNFGDAGQTEDDHIVSGYTYEDTVIPQIEYLSGNKAIAIRDDGFTIYTGGQIPKEETTVNVEDEIVSTFFDDDTIGLVFKNGNKDKQYTMKVYSSSGKEKFTKDFNIPYTTIKMSDNSIIMYNGSQICVMNKRGVEKYSGTVDGAIKEFLKVGWNRYLLVLDTGVNIIKMQ